MQLQKDLNNVQRKMLDQIYTEQFQKRADMMMEERSRSLLVLQDKLLKTTMQDKDVKKMIEAGRTFYQLEQQLKHKLLATNVFVEGTASKEPALKIGYRYSSTQGVDEFPEITAYNQETRRVELVLSEKRKEMRAKIYGIAATYEEVDKEIKELLKDL